MFSPGSGRSPHEELAASQWPGQQETPLHEELAASLRHAIKSGELPPGARLPTEAELASEHGVSRNTVRLAMAELLADGLITRGRGRDGRRVQRREVREVQAARAGWGHAHVGAPETAMAPAWVSARLGIAEGAAAIVRRAAAGRTQPHRLCESWRPADVAGDAEPTCYEDEFEGRMPFPDEEERLGIQPGWSVIIQTRTGHTDAGPVSVTRTIWPADRTRLLINIPGDLARG
jgi:GntR family transcriptional regulator